MKTKAFYKDMEKYAEYKRRYQRGYRKRTGTYEPREWTDHEINLVLAQKMTDRELSKLIKRSIAAIQIKRSRLRKEEVCG